ncbi:hypothetical protein [Hymenobacter sp. PAMC 26628]|uniref:hypothetical protein n=1 Tax=Hymenobacter sp. PAMC 26628 TaxID=1484118 RepID=UPI0012FF974C|nr:hypothetical protein [Hymenobacter sp. PAMC 26628]
MLTFDPRQCSRQTNMNHHPSIFDLPPEDQTELLGALRQKLADAEKEDDALAQEASRLELLRIPIAEKIEKYKLFLSHLPNNDVSFSDSTKVPVDVKQPALTPSVSSVSTEERYNRKALQPDKLLFILRHPEIYNQVTFVGAQSIVNALLQEEPELKNVSNATMMRRIGPAVSRLAQDGKIVKRVENGRPSRIHYLSPDWFDNDKLKPEYQAKLSQLDLVTQSSRS